LLSIDGLNQLSTVYNFSQIRISCSKPWHGRTLDIKTTTTSEGTWARDWLLQRKTKSSRPPSCGSYARLPEDTSYIGANCHKWYQGKWWINQLYDDPLGAHDGDVWYGLDLHDGRDWCDDDCIHPHFSSVGQWSFFVR